MRPERDADPLPPSSAVAMKGQSYTSTPPMGRTACTELQCLYKGAIYPFAFYGTTVTVSYCGICYKQDCGYMFRPVLFISKPIAGVTLSIKLLEVTWSRFPSSAVV